MRYYPPSIFNAYNICKRQAWLMMRNLSADQYNEFIEIGRLLDQNSFSREKKKIYLADLNATIDMVIRDGEIYYVAEIKKSSKTLKSGILQLKYYLFLLEKRKGIKTNGIIKIPKEKISKKIALTLEDKKKIEDILEEMHEVLKSEVIPKIDKKLSSCKNCGHFEFCWS